MISPSRLRSKLSRAALVSCLLLTGLTVHLRAQNNDSTDTAPGGNLTPAPVPAAAPIKLPPLDSAGTSLLQNGDFETPSPEDPSFPEAWAKADGITWEKEGYKHFLRLVQKEPGKMLMAYREVGIPAGTKALEVTIRYRTADIKTGANNWFDARTIFHFLDVQREQVKGDPGAMVFSKKTATWTTVTSKFVVPEGATTLQLMPALFQVAAGTLDLSEIRITALTATEADAMAAAAAAAAQKKADEIATIDKDLALPAITPEIKVSGNKLVTADGKEVWLQGLNVCSLEWTATGNNVLWSMEVAINDWKANCIRLPVNNDYWFGRGKDQAQGEAGQTAYRELVDKAVKLAAAKGAYLVLDLHRFQAPDEGTIAFWKDAATRYKNNPAVLFDIFNEPFGTTWEVWRNGGEVKKEGKNAGVYQSVGMQAVVEAVRSTAANNVIIAGGLDWAYDNSGILTGFALEDKTGYGIMYSVHVYNWKTDWQGKFMALADKYPLFLGECGADAQKMSFIPLAAQEDPATWVPDLLGLIQKHHLNWTGWSFHTSATPNMLADWNYTPTTYWGAPAKDALHGKAYELKKMR